MPRIPCQNIYSFFLVTREQETAKALTREGEEVDKLINSTWRYEDPSSYPDLITTVPVLTAISVLHSRSLVQNVRPSEGREFFWGDGVTPLTEESMRLLGQGARYLFPVHSSNLPMSTLETAFDDFYRRLTWRVMVRNDVEPYNPKLPLEPSPNWPKGIPHWVGDMYQAVWTAFKAEVSKARVETMIHATRAKPTGIANLRTELAERNLLVLSTDKNLGLAVVGCDWYHKQCLSHLENDRVYVEVHEDRAVLQARRVVKYSVSIIGEGYNFAAFTEQERKYIHESLDASHTSHKELIESIPMFRGIPKVHKKPLKLRPIVPFFTWRGRGVSKVLSVHLQSLLPRYPIILTKSEDLAEKLTNLIVPGKPGQTLYLCTGDISGFYTNVDSDVAVTAITTALRRDRRSGEIDAVTKLYRPVNDQLPIKYNGRYFLQKEGLAMGANHSPDVANLYCAQEEYSWPRSHGAWLKMFRRYIDDLFCIVLASSRADALLKLRSLQYPNLQLNWEISETRVTFLDMSIMFDESRNKILVSPYRKSLNQFQRVPFASAHPNYMKRAVILGEAARLARLSSEMGIYESSLHQLREDYNRLGYTREWFDLNFDAKSRRRLWESRYTHIDTGMLKDVVALKSELDPLWDHVDFSKDKQVITDFIGGNNEAQQDERSRRLNEIETLGSKKRPSNLGDYLNANNKRILADFLANINSRQAAE